MWGSPEDFLHPEDDEVLPGVVVWDAVCVECFCVAFVPGVADDFGYFVVGG